MNPWKLAFFISLLYILLDTFTPAISQVLGSVGKSSSAKVPDAPRALSSTSSTSGSSTASEHHHQQDSLFFLFNALIVGTVVLHLTTLPHLHSLQQTVVLFVSGMIYSLVQEGLKVKGDVGVFGKSYDMWMAIDPHLLLFTMLPALLAGDAMGIDTNVANRVAKQCLFLAGPGVLFGSFAIAGFLYVYLPYDWPFLLCLACGSILAATDPVAVVGLLKELGAAPTLTVQIQGESLLNDGTAIVLYTVAYNMLKGEEYDTSDIVIFLVKVAFCAVALGAVIGFFFLQWIKFAGNRANHHSGMIQTALTLCCAYWSFCIAEGALKISGVLCTVTASLVLADRMWPSIVDKNSMVHIWHMFEYLGNSIIFFLAGALTGNTMVYIPFEDYLHLIVLYFVTLFVRGVLIFGSRPILRYLSVDKEAVSVADAAVMTWGGLRGAVGLALAIVVSVEQADGKIPEMDGRRVLFYVGGIATLTLCVNATTCPMLVRWLGITRTPKAKQQMLHMICNQLTPMLDADSSSQEGHKVIHDVLHGVRHHVDKLCLYGSSEASLQRRKMEGSSLKCPATICEELQEARTACDTSSSLLALLDIPQSHFAQVEDDLETIIREHNIDGALVKSVNEAFLCLLKDQYWSQIEAGEFIHNAKNAEVLLASVAVAFKHARSHLADLAPVLRHLKTSHEYAQVDNDTVEDEMRHVSSQSSRGSTASRAAVRVSDTHFCDHSVSYRLASLLPSALTYKTSFLQALQPGEGQLIQMINSTATNLIVSAIIAANAIFILLEQTQRTDENYSHAAWLVFEIFFTVTFTFEFAIKLIALRCWYFCDPWNLFDFSMVILSIIGLVIEVQSLGNDTSSESQIKRLNRVFRVLRILRLFRLVKLLSELRKRLSQKSKSMKLAEYMKTLVILRAFVRAHVNSQQKLVEIFGGPTTSVEVARCIMESQTELYLAMHLALAEANNADYHDLLSLKLLREQFGVISSLIHFVDSAGDTGLTGREIATITNPLENHLHNFDVQMDRTLSGFGNETSSILKGMKLFPTVNGEEKPPETIVRRVMAWEDSEISGSRESSKELRSRGPSKERKSREPSKECQRLPSKISKQSPRESSTGDSVSIYSSQELRCV